MKFIKFLILNILRSE